MGAVKQLFSFRGEIGRGQFWLTYLVLSLVGFFVLFAYIAVSRVVGGPQIGSDGDPDWPRTVGVWYVFAGYWCAVGLQVWVFGAAVVRRLRDVGIALKWLLVLAMLFALYGLTMDHFIHEGAVRISPLGWFTLLFTGLPACGMGFWIFVSVFFVAGYKSKRIDPARLPEGWKN